MDIQFKLENIVQAKLETFDGRFRWQNWLDLTDPHIESTHRKLSIQNMPN